MNARVANLGGLRSAVCGLRTAVLWAAAAFLVVGADTAQASVNTTCIGDGGGQMREFFIPTALVIVEDNLVRVRVPASEDDELILHMGGQTLTEHFGPNASVIITVDASGGSPSPFPFETKSANTYEDAYVEFIFVGGVEMEQQEVNGKVGLLVHSDGAINVIDPTGALPFSAGQLQESNRIEFGFPGNGNPDPDPGPHQPD